MMVQGQLTLEDARTHEQSNIITQSLGDLFRTPQPESREYPLFKDDHILICSDGLNGMLSDENMEQIFASDYESLDKIAEQMITEANLAGGHDNITLILTKVTEGMPYSEDIVKKGSGEKTMMTEAVPKKKNKILMDFIIAAVLASLIFLGYHYRNQWLPLFKKSNTKTQENTTLKIDTPKITTNVETPKPPVTDTSNVVVPTPSVSSTTIVNQKHPAKKPNKPNYKPKPEPKPRDEGQLKLVDNNVQQNEQIDTTKQNDK